MKSVSLYKLQLISWAIKYSGMVYGFWPMRWAGVILLAHDKMLSFWSRIHLIFIFPFFPLDTKFILSSNRRGYMHFRDQMYLIEPMWAPPAEEGRQSSGSHGDAGPHAVYHYRHLRKKRSSCSHGNTTTFYDHGARPSGLFQLGSLVKTQCSWVISKFKVHVSPFSLSLDLYVLNDLSFFVCYSEKQSSDQRAHKKSQDGGAFRGGGPHRGSSRRVSPLWLIADVVY